jgi:hypothetical protein
MITQELIDYVKTQLSAGVAREKITSDLQSQGGWVLEQIDEAFAVVQRPVFLQVPQEEVAPGMTQPPKSIKYFEWVMYASFIASMAMWIFQFASLGFSTGLIIASAVPIIGILIKFYCVYKVVYHRAEWARVVLAVFLGFNTFFIFVILNADFSDPLFLFVALPIILEIIAIYFLFSAPSRVWLGVAQDSQKFQTLTASNTTWSETIPSINKNFTIISVGVFAIVLFWAGGPDVFNSEIALFAYAMLGTILIIGALNYYETKMLAKKYSYSYSRLDVWFTSLAVLRNIVLFLSVLPFIQIFGMAAMIFGGIPYLVVYYSMVRSRNKSAEVVRENNVLYQ